MSGVTSSMSETVYTVARYPKRTLRKINTMFSIYEMLPARFNAIKKGVNRSPTTISKRLEEMINLGIVSIEERIEKRKLRNFAYNVYHKSTEFKTLLKAGRYASITPKRHFSNTVLMKMKMKKRIKKRGKVTSEKLREEYSSVEDDAKELLKSLDSNNSSRDN